MDADSEKSNTVAETANAVLPNSNEYKTVDEAPAKPDEQQIKKQALKNRSSSRYQDKQKNKKDARKGREYVDKTKQLCVEGTQYLLKVNELYKDYYVAPMIRILSEIKAITQSANAIYMHGQREHKQGKLTLKYCYQHEAEMIDDFTKRSEMLSDLLEDKFRQFDSRFEDLMDQIDYEKTERARFRRIINNIARKGLVYISSLSETAKAALEKDKDGNYIIPVRVKVKNYDYEFISCNGSKRTRFGLTPKNVQRIKKLENEAQAEIRKRIHMDKANIRRVREKAETYREQNNIRSNVQRSAEKTSDEKKNING